MQFLGPRCFFACDLTPLLVSWTILTIAKSGAVAVPSIAKKVKFTS
jgi:hypothetical protein